MKYLGIAAILPLLAITPTLAQDIKLSNGFYTQLTGYALFLKDKDFPLNGSRGDIDYDLGWAGGLSFGYRFDSGFRLQVEGSYGQIGLDEYQRSGRDLDLNNGDLTVVNGLAGIYYDFHVADSWRPYVGVGGGGTYTDFDNVPGRRRGNRDADIDFTAYGEGGLEIGLADHLSLIPAYRYQWINNGEHGTDDDIAHEALLSLRVYFD